MSRFSAELPALLLSLTLLSAFVGVVLPAVWSARPDRRRDAARVLGQLLAGLRRPAPLAPPHTALYTEIMSDETSAELYHPGDVVPASGIYECDCGRAHEYSTDVKGHRFPPLRHDCGGHGWRLKAATPSGA
ncbi:hypothetical protein [Streptomyces sp. NPDC004376]